MNTLKSEEKTQVVSLLCEGSSIRTIERVTDVHRDTVMQLGGRTGQDCGRNEGEEIIIAPRLFTGRREQPVNRLAVCS